MGKNKFKRRLFFWVDALHISKNERITILVVTTMLALLTLVNIVVDQRSVQRFDHYDELLKEFERRSHQKEIERQEQLAPYRGIEQEMDSENSVSENESIQPEIISINSATKEQLMSLPGIGASYAQRIIDYREAHGEFSALDDLIKVKGIGEKTLAKIKSRITL